MLAQAALALVLALQVAPVPPAGADPETADLLEALAQLEGADFLQDPEAVLAWVTLPRTAVVGATVVLKLSIENARADASLRLSSIDLAESFLQGFEVLDLAPKPRNRTQDLGMLSLEYPVDVPAGQTREFEFTLRATKPGVFIGDVDVYEGKRFLTRTAQVRVQP